MLVSSVPEALVVAACAQIAAQTNSNPTVAFHAAAACMLYVMLEICAPPGGDRGRIHGAAERPNVWSL